MWKTSCRFCQGKAADPFAAGKLRQVFLLLLFGAEVADRAAADGCVNRQDRRAGPITCGDFLDYAGIAYKIRVKAAVGPCQIKAP